MNPINKLYSIVLSHLGKRLCENRIPRSGEKGKAVNCFVLAIDRDRGPFQLITKISGNLLTVLEWNETSYTDEKVIELEQIDRKQLRIIHYYGLSEIRYYGLWDYLRNGATGFQYLLIIGYGTLSSVNQYFFIKKKLVTKQRMELLQYLVAHHYESGGGGLGVIELMSQLYSIRWISHPDSESQQRKVELYLASLVDSGELEKNGTSYRVKGKAISTIESFEEEERRHTDNVRLQRKAIWVSVILAVFALIQADVIKLPTVLDYSNTALTQENGELHNK
ncbi:MAG: hypothetical protein G8D81_13260 [gamma proteobacterium symbiont of Clathrolucina costata]|uniref:Uncharacterized protein n=1 Tax=Candidatus Thiodiazotropha taylori TaxID=2792791 RepID=A0A9E4NNY8_9GAMM|nr:hypothetical protein [Candidatus Thiodiazotropha taylori]MCW4239210.1 hypothetical protein [Candidatus Thiodiazotropha endolucinida]